MRILINNEEEFKLVMKKVKASYKIADSFPCLLIDNETYMQLSYSTNYYDQTAYQFLCDELKVGDKIIFTNNTTKILTRLDTYIFYFEDTYIAKNHAMIDWKATYYANRKSIKDLTVTINWDSSKLIQQINKIKEELISMKQFTKGDLRDGMVVMTRLGIPYLYLNGEFIGHKYSIRNMKDDLTHLDTPSADIVEVFTTRGRTFNSLFRQDYLTSIWKRPNPRINELKTEISQLQEQLHKLTTELSDLEAK